MQDTKKKIEKIEEVLQAILVKITSSGDRPFSLWEVFAGEGRATKTACRRKNMIAHDFSISEDWDFTSPCVISSTAAKGRARCCAVFSNLQVMEPISRAECCIQTWLCRET